MTPTISDPTLFEGDYNIRPQQCRLLRFSHKTTISGPEHYTYNLRPQVFRMRLQYDTYNLRPHEFRVRLQYQAPNMTPTISDPTLFEGDYNIRPRQCRLLRFLHKTTISGPEHYTYNLRPQVFRMRLQYEAPTMSVVTFFARDYNIRPRT